MKDPDKGNGRTKTGKFAPGNDGGPGRPPRATEHEYLNTLFNACPLETWQAICEKATAAAQAGDKDARKFLSSYLLPTVPEREQARTRERQAEENPFSFV